MKQDKKEELQSRRQFFKKAAKTALPILGAIALANIPLVSKASEKPTSCYYGCSGSCDGTCSGGCMGCSGTCTGGCQGSCGGNCWGVCRSSSY